MDIKINSDEGKFKFRVCGLLKHKNKYLVVKINNNSFYCLPGGHVELGEDTDTAVLREMREELDFEFKIKKLFAINQNFFKTADNKIFHELGFYYFVEAKNENDIVFEDYSRDELDKGEIQHLDYKWCTLEELKNIDLKPTFIVDALQNENLVLNITRN